MHLAPIVLFVYNRPRHTEQALNALAQNELANESILYIYADGPKNDAPAAVLENIKKTRELIKSKKWCKEVFVIEAEVNQGLANAVINGVTDVVNKHGKVIVLEDDIITSKYFLQYMNDALDAYANEQKVISIGALNFFATDKKVGDTFFIPIPDCWGWATWKNRWELFETNAQKLLNRLRENNLVNKFNLEGAYGFEDMLIQQIKGNISSWAIRWQAVAYLNDRLTLYPKFSVTKNIGFDAEGTHAGADKYSKHIKFANSPIKVEHILPAQQSYIIKKMINGYANVSGPTKTQKLKTGIKKTIKYFLPPALNKLHAKIKSAADSSWWQGNYPSWQQAKQNSGGYDSSIILEKTKQAILKVKNGEAAGERDSVLFDTVQHSKPVVDYLLKIACENNNQLDIIDFGGSLGSSYFQTRDMIPAVVKLSWSVVEQANYIAVGNVEIKEEQLGFYYSIDEALEKNRAHVLLLSSVLQYLEKPYEFIHTILSYGFKYIIVDRTAFIDGAERLTVQNVPEYIYPASYPAWFFNAGKFQKAFSARYKLLAEFEPYPGMVIPLDKAKGFYKGFIFKLQDQ